MDDTKPTTPAAPSTSSGQATPKTGGSPIYVPKEPSRSYQGSGGPRGPRPAGAPGAGGAPQSGGYGSPAGQRSQGGFGGQRSGGPGGGRPGQGGRGGAGGRPPRTPSEYDQKILNIRRVARVVAGGRRFTFSVAMVIGNRKGSVGVGVGKAGDTTLAIDKAARVAKKHMIKVNMTKDGSIAHEVVVKYSSATIMLRPAKGKGLVAGSAVRYVLELAGVTDTTAKIQSPSKNKLNIAQATIMALKKLSKADAR